MIVVVVVVVVVGDGGRDGKGAGCSLRIWGSGKEILDGGAGEGVEGVFKPLIYGCTVCTHLYCVKFCFCFLAP